MVDISKVSVSQEVNSNEVPLKNWAPVDDSSLHDINNPNPITTSRVTILIYLLNFLCECAGSDGLDQELFNERKVKLNEELHERKKRRNVSKVKKVIVKKCIIIEMFTF